MGPVLWCVAAGGGTSLGALLLAGWRAPSAAVYALSLAGAAGIMLAATVLGLVPAALEAGSFAQVALGFAAGVLVIAVLDARLPALQARLQRDAASPAGDDQRRAFLLTGAISLHNLPEGAAVGIAFAGGGTELGIALALAILAHNIPEGLAVALPMRAMGMGMGKTIWWTTVTGLIEVAGALIAYFVGTSIEGLLPWGLAFAAGAMMYVVVDEMVPAAHARQGERATVAFLGAFLAMAAVIELLGGFIQQA